MRRRSVFSCSPSWRHSLSHRSHGVCLGGPKQVTRLGAPLPIRGRLFSSPVSCVLMRICLSVQPEYVVDGRGLSDSPSLQTTEPRSAPRPGAFFIGLSAMPPSLHLSPRYRWPMTCSPSSCRPSMKLDERLRKFARCLRRPLSKYCRRSQPRRQNKTRFQNKAPQGRSHYWLSLFLTRSATGRTFQQKPWSESGRSRVGD
jgi:hypothetical protein